MWRGAGGGSQEGGSARARRRRSDTRGGEGGCAGPAGYGGPSASLWPYATIVSVCLAPGSALTTTSSPRLVTRAS